MHPHLRVATWNLERPSRAGWKRPVAQLRLIEAVDADVWVLSEGRVSLPLGTSHPHALHGPAHAARRPDADERWVSIWSRFPVRDVVVAPAPWTVAAVVESPIGDVAVYGTVLPWHSEPGDGPAPARAWAVHAAELERQGREWADLTSRFERVVVAGDFNQAFGTPGYGTTGLRARHRELYRAAGLTCLTDRLVLDGQPVVDHVLVSRPLAGGAQVSATWGRRDAGGTRLSDHSGVSVDLR